MNVVIRRNVFTPVLTDALRALLRREEMFGPATVTGDAAWRSARVAHVQHLLEGRLVCEAIGEVVGAVAAELGLDAPRPWRVEVQLSCYGNGDYFKLHNDSGTPDVATRWLSWVSYLDVGPRTFTGGELHVHDYVSPFGGKGVAVVEPHDGETVFFPANALHEVMPVTAGPEWASRRFSVNGWVNKV